MRDQKQSNANLLGRSNFTDKDTLEYKKFVINRQFTLIIILVLILGLYALPILMGARAGSLLDFIKWIRSIRSP